MLLQPLETSLLQVLLSVPIGTSIPSFPATVCAGPYIGTGTPQDCDYNNRAHKWNDPYERQLNGSLQRSFKIRTNENDRCDKIQ
jgi:hypothetical protein